MSLISGSVSANDPRLQRWDQTLSPGPVYAVRVLYMYVCVFRMCVLSRD